MKHYSERQWTNFLRGATPVDFSAAMREHLKSGCPKCLSIERELAGRLVNQPVPPLLSEQRPARVLLAMLCGQSSRFARKVFDSVQQPRPSSVRGSLTPSVASLAPEVHQLLYDAAPYVLDVRLDLEQGPQRVLLTGQVVRSLNRQAPLQDLAVALLRGTESLRETATNRFGEFQIEYQAAPDLVLGVLVGPQEVICIALPDLTDRG